MTFRPRSTALAGLILIAGLSWSFATRAQFNERPANVETYVQQYRYLAVELNQATGIPIPVILAVAGLETGWGTSELARNANNHFGLKSKEDWTGWEYCKPSIEYGGLQATQSWECFRKYPLIRASYIDFGIFITSSDNYQHLHEFPAWDNRSWAEGLHAGGYATDPGYANKILRIIWRYRLWELQE